METVAAATPMVPPTANGASSHAPLGLAPKPAPVPMPAPVVTSGNGFTAELAPVGAARPLAAVPAADGNGSLEGKTFGRYRLVKKIADGGMSEIYRAVAFGPEGFSRSFVVKRLKPELAHQKEAVAQFIDEARVQASLVHSNVVPVFDFGTMNDDYYMTEEYIAGRDVMQFSHRCVEDTRYPMDPRIAYYIAHETLQALHYAHTRSNAAGENLDIVHRDVSSMNIMVAASGDVKLVDFGIAKANTRVSRTHHGIIKGNAHFMSPEHARGQPVDARSDVFCVGLVLYFCLTNQMLYTGQNDLEVLYRAAHGPTQVELEMIDMLDAPAPDILHRALAINPAARFQTAGQFAAALAPHIAGAKAVTADLVGALFGDELKAELA
jgi:serine/threonine protein kinase